MFWNRKRKEPVPECPAPDTAVCLHLGGFYYDEKPIRPSYQMLSLYPHEIIDGDPTFLAFVLRCASLILADYPFVLESVIGNDHLADCSPIIEAHRNSGGQFFLAEKLRLLARVNAPTLVTRMPEYEHEFYEWEFYAYREELSNVQVQAIANNLRSSEFALRVFYHACHDYFLIETAEDPIPCIKRIEELCSQEGRKIFH
jgi:hypothetical protein